MLSKLKCPVFSLILVLLIVKIFQILEKEFMLEVKQTYTNDQEDIPEIAREYQPKNDVDEINIETNEQNVKSINENQNKHNKKTTTSSTATIGTTTELTTTTESTTTELTTTTEGDIEKKDVTNEVLADITQTGSKKENVTQYHGHDLLKDPVFKFDPHFKNPCWFRGKELRCLPYFYVIGVKKCGTSDIFFRSALHPDVVNPGFKEAQWFARKRFRPGGLHDDINEYIEMFHNAAAMILDNANTSSDGQISNYRHITGEGSPSNFHLNAHWKYLPGNENLDQPRYVILNYIRHFLPQAKLIITFRDPVERLYSDYYHEYGTLMKDNKPNPRQFHKVVTEGIQLYKDCFNQRSVRSCVYEPSLYGQTKIQIQLGIYYIFWMDLTRLFLRNQILVLQNKNLRDKERTMSKVYRFLKLRDLDDEEMRTVVSKKETFRRRKSYKDEGPMFNETLKILQDFYRPFNKIMSEATDDPDFLYGYADNTS